MASGEAVLLEDGHDLSTRPRPGEHVIDTAAFQLGEAGRGELRRDATLAVAGGHGRVDQARSVLRQRHVQVVRRGVDEADELFFGLGAEHDAV